MSLSCRPRARESCPGDRASVGGTLQVLRRINFREFSLATAAFHGKGTQEQRAGDLAHAAIQEGHVLAVEQDRFRAAMARLGAAVNIISTDGDAGPYGMTASAVCSVSDSPPTILVCVNRMSNANATMKANGVFCVNVLSHRHQEIAGRFANRAVSIPDRFAGENQWTTLATGSPVMLDAAVALDCRIADVTEVGTHTVFFGEVQDLLISEHSDALIYFERDYHAVGQTVSDGS